MAEQGKRSWRRWILGAGLALVVGFVGFAALRYWLDRDFYDEERINELKQTKLVSAVPAKTAENEWPQWRGPGRNGISAETGLRFVWPEKDTLQKLTKWEAKTGPGYASMAVADGRVYTIFQEGDDETVVCWDAETGKELWRFRYDANLSAHPYEYGPGPRSTPTVDDDRVYTVGGTGIMHCLKTKPKTPKGEVVWKKELLDEFNANNLKWGVAFSPLIADDLVYTTPGGADGYALVAMNKHTGEVAWHSLSGRAGYSSPILATIAGKKQILFFTAAELVSVTPDKGELLWRYPWATSFEVNAATPIVVGKYVFISSGYGKGCGVLEIETDAEGKLEPHLVYRNRKMKNHFSSSVFYKGYLYGFSDTILTCMSFVPPLDETKRQVAWTFPDRAAFGKGSLIIADGHLILLGETGLLAVAEATPAKIEIKSSLQIPTDRAWSLPALANGLLYVRDREKLYCLDLRKERNIK